MSIIIIALSLLCAAAVAVVVFSVTVMINFMLDLLSSDDGDEVVAA